MSNKDEFELDVEETAEDEFDDVSLDEEAEASADAAPKKKKSGGGLVAFVAVLALLGGGGFAAVKFLGVQLPFDVPGLTQTAQAPVQQQQQPVADTMTASADLPVGELPPQPAAPADSNNLPFGIPAADAPQDSAEVNAPWGMEESPAAAADSLKQMPVEAFDDGAAVTAQAEDANIVDPFSFGAQDVTAAVNEPEVAPVAAATAAAEIVDPFAGTASPVSAPAVEAPVAEKAAPVLTTAPAEDAAAKAHTAALEKKLAATEKSLADAEKALKKANDDLAKKSEELARAQSDLKAAQKEVRETKTTTAKAAAESKPAAAAKPAERTAKAAAKPAAAPARKIDWVLRSAKPGVAWVSEKGSNEMRTVSVGDTLAGIGKVTAIATDAQGRWIVNGTRGSINQ